jgi:AraC-like DNA-binding protein
MNPFQTIRMFARATGLTPHAYLVQRRIELARDLIRQRVALADVAMTAGFSDQSHLARTFVARFGYTPGTYAKAFS